MSLTPVSCNSWWLTVVTTIGTFWRFSVRFCAVTTISSTLRGASDEGSALGEGEALGAGLAADCAMAADACNAKMIAAPDATTRR